MQKVLCGHLRPFSLNPDREAASGWGWRQGPDILQKSLIAWGPGPEGPLGSRFSKDCWEVNALV